MPSSSLAIPKGPKTARKKALSKVGKSGKVEKRAKIQKAKMVEKAKAVDKTAKVPGPKAVAQNSVAPKRSSSKAPSAQVFLIAVKRRRETMRVYAVLTPTEPEALDIVRAANDAEAAVEPVGRLSKKLARPLKLMAGEPRLI